MQRPQKIQIKYMTNNTSKVWGARFKKANTKLVSEFSASIKFDYILAPYDIQVSIAHASMLNSVAIITNIEKDAIISGLKQILFEIENNNFEFSIELEDIHMNIENRLIEICGDTGKKLHTARSRNDQVATDIRLYLRDNIDNILLLINKLNDVLLDLAEQHTSTIMPGFTHLQTAQPINFAHHLLAYVAMFERDKDRLVENRVRVNSLPLGSAALAGTSFPINRKLVAELLDFELICSNSIDAVSDRDFAIEFTSNISILMMHLSRFCEEIILWSSAQFNFIELSDSFCTGSSIMPQKKNPDIAELIRGKSARVFGNLNTLLVLMKAQPLAYNKDNQEDKEPLFDTVNTVSNSVLVFTGMLKEITVNVGNMQKSAELGFITATDLADYLVKKGLAFRDAHHIVGSVVAYCIENKQNLTDLSLETLQKFSPVITKSVFKILTLEGSMSSRNHIGGTASKQVLSAIKKYKK